MRVWSQCPRWGIVRRAVPQTWTVSLRALPGSSWETTKNVPLRGMRNMKNMCYLNSVAQVLMRTPAVLEWVMHHGVSDCSGEGGSCVVCALFRTYCQVLAGFGQGADSVPVLAAQRQLVGPQFAGDYQHDVFELSLIHI